MPRLQLLRNSVTPSTQLVAACCCLTSRCTQLPMTEEAMGAVSFVGRQKIVDKCAPLLHTTPAPMLADDMVLTTSRHLHSCDLLLCHKHQLPCHSEGELSELHAGTAGAAAAGRCAAIAAAMMRLVCKHRQLEALGLWSKMGLMSQFREVELLDDAVDHWGAAVHLKVRVLLRHITASASVNVTAMQLATSPICHAAERMSKQPLLPCGRGACWWSAWQPRVNCLNEGSAPPLRMHMTISVSCITSEQCIPRRRGACWWRPCRAWRIGGQPG